ncbi:ATP-binding protein [Streptomyces sp. NPDC059788]|uniref:ATP-binding protein n=1 Tax=Streptomyces sp. NPDC059788 TaxID=3346948 RepID=UPI0036608A8B
MTATRPNATGVPGYSETLLCKPESVRRARRLVDTALDTWGLDALIDEVSVVASELVTNAVQHSKCRRLRFRVSRPAHGRVLVTVTDRSFARPILRAPCAQDTHGRGLILVAELADRWGTKRRSFGKSVWAELAAEVTSNPCPPAPL